MQAPPREGLPARGLRRRRRRRRRVAAHAGLHAAADAGGAVPLLRLPVARRRFGGGGAVPAPRRGGGVPGRVRAAVRRAGARPVRVQGGRRQLRRRDGGGGSGVGAVVRERRGVRRRHRRVAPHREARRRRQRVAEHSDPQVRLPDPLRREVRRRKAPHVSRRTRTCGVPRARAPFRGVLEHAARRRRRAGAGQARRRGRRRQVSVGYRRTVRRGQRSQVPVHIGLQERSLDAGPPGCSPREILVADGDATGRAHGSQARRGARAEPSRHRAHPAEMADHEAEGGLHEGAHPDGEARDGAGLQLRAIGPRVAGGHAPAGVLRHGGRRQHRAPEVRLLLHLLRRRPRAARRRRRVGQRRRGHPRHGLRPGRAAAPRVRVAPVPRHGRGGGRRRRAAAVPAVRAPADPAGGGGRVRGERRQRVPVRDDGQVGGAPARRRRPSARGPGHGARSGGVGEVGEVGAPEQRRVLPQVVRPRGHHVVPRPAVQGYGPQREEEEGWPPRRVDAAVRTRGLRRHPVTGSRVGEAKEGIDPERAPMTDAIVKLLASFEPTNLSTTTVITSSFLLGT